MSEVPPQPLYIPLDVGVRTLAVSPESPSPTPWPAIHSPVAPSSPQASQVADETSYIPSLLFGGSVGVSPCGDGSLLTDEGLPRSVQPANKFKPPAVSPIAPSQEGCGKAGASGVASQPQWFDQKLQLSGSLVSSRGLLAFSGLFILSCGTFLGLHKLTKSKWKNRKVFENGDMSCRKRMQKQKSRLNWQKRYQTFIKQRGQKYTMENSKWERRISPSRRLENVSGWWHKIV